MWLYTRAQWWSDTKAQCSPCQLAFLLLTLMRGPQDNNWQVNKLWVYCREVLKHKLVWKTQSILQLSLSSQSHILTVVIWIHFMWMRIILLVSGISLTWSHPLNFIRPPWPSSDSCPSLPSLSPCYLSSFWALKSSNLSKTRAEGS